MAKLFLCFLSLFLIFPAHAAINTNQTSGVVCSVRFVPQEHAVYGPTSASFVLGKRGDCAGQGNQLTLTVATTGGSAPGFKTAPEQLISLVQMLQHAKYQGAMINVHYWENAPGDQDNIADIITF
jgi:hypothetical protein